MADPEVVKSALQMLAESEGREFKPAPEPEKPQTPQLQPLDQYSAQFGQAAEVAPSTMSYPEQMRNVWETVKPTTQGAKDAAAIAAALREKHIIVRHFKLPRIDQHLRITIGTDEQCAALIKELKAIV